MRARPRRSRRTTCWSAARSIGPSTWSPGSPRSRTTRPSGPSARSTGETASSSGGAIRDGSRPVPAVGPVPLAVVWIVAKADRGERPPDVVAREVERVAPPRVAGDAEIAQDLLEVQADLQTDLALALRHGSIRVALGPVGHREEEIPERAMLSPSRRASPLSFRSAEKTS